MEDGIDLIATLRDLLGRRERRTIQRPERAAVLVPLIDDGGPLRLLLTRRTEALPTHQGQVAFPGGHVDPEDADATRAALREAEEEIGLPRERVEVIGLLDDHLTWQETVAVTPVVGVVRGPVALRPDPAEVARVFSIPLLDLSRPERWRSRSEAREGRAKPLHFFDHEGEILWGLSARIVLSLLGLASLGDPTRGRAGP